MRSLNCSDIRNCWYGQVSEWLKEHAWKVCIRQRIEGSNPSLTAISTKVALNQIHFLTHSDIPPEPTISGTFCHTKSVLTSQDLGH